MKKIYFLSCILLLIFITPAYSQISIYLKIIDDKGATIEGESIVKGYERQIIAKTFAQESSSCSVVSGGGAGTCKPSTSNFAFDVDLNKAINPLRRIMYRGAHMHRVEVTFTKTTGDGIQKYYQIIMEEVLVTKVSDFSGGDAVNGNQLEFTPARVGWLYYPQDSKGGVGQPVKFGWDIASNMEWTNF